MCDTFGIWISPSGSITVVRYCESSVGLSGCVSPAYPSTLLLTCVYTHKRADTAEQGDALL